MQHITKLLLVLFLSLAFTAALAQAGEPGKFKPEGKGYFYYLHDASEGDGQTNKFDISRMYIGAKYFVSEEFTIRYLTDISHAAGGGKFEVFTKYAYLDWKLGDRKNLVMGLQGTNNWSMPEKAWGYRAIQYSPMESFGKYWDEWDGFYEDHLDYYANVDPSKAGEIDAQKANFATAKRSKMGSSADLGISLKCKPTSDIYVNVMVRNGLGYKKAEDDMYKNFQARGGTFLMEKAVHVSAFVEVEPWKGVDEDGESKGYMNLQWDVMASYTMKDKFTLGVDANSKTFKGSLEDITAMCISVFGHGYIMPGKLKALARYDMYNTGFNDVERPTGVNEYETNGSRIIVGLDYKAHKKVSIIPNFQMVSYEDSDLDSHNSAYIHVYFKI